MQHFVIRIMNKIMYDPIEGFEYEQGYEYVIEVKNRAYRKSTCRWFKPEIFTDQSNLQNKEKTRKDYQSRNHWIISFIKYSLY